MSDISNMPFTTSHPAIVLPLKKLWPQYFSLTGLMAGAMAPDLLYFLIAATAPRGISHSWSGLFVFCLPAGILFSFAFHWLFKKEFIISLPCNLDKYLSGLAISKFNLRGISEWVIFIISVIIGILSHFFWDAFTHAQGEIAQLIPFLNDSIHLLGKDFQITRILQHFSTLFGAIVIVLFLTKGEMLLKPKKDFTRRSIRDKIIFWCYSAIFTGLFVIFVFWFYSTLYPDLPIPFWKTIGLASWAGLFWAVVFCSLFKEYSKKQK